MALTKLTCPECGKVLKPTKPIPSGKKVKCPRCENVFVAAEDEEILDEEVEEAPRKKAPAKPPAPSKPVAKGKPRPEAKKSPPKSSDDDEDGGGTYGYIKDPDEGDEEKKPKVNYAPDMSVKDLRGPAQAIVMKPSNWLIMTGIVGFIGWLTLLTLIIIPAVFPLEDKPPEGQAAPAPPPQPGNPGEKKEKPSNATVTSFFKIWGFNIAGMADWPWYQFFPSLLPFVLGMIYCAVATAGGVKLQNLESRGWGIASSIMLMIPLTLGGVQIIFALVLKFILIDGLEVEAEYGNFLIIGTCTVLWLVAAAVGGFGLMTCNNEDVIAGFEYEAE